MEPDYELNLVKVFWTKMRCVVLPNLKLKVREIALAEYSVLNLGFINECNQWVEDNNIYKE